MITTKKDYIGYNTTDIIDLPRTCTELRKMEPFEFQNLVIARMNGKQNRSIDINIVGWTRKRNEYGIGYEVGFNAVVQVKRSDRIGKQTIHELAYAMSIDTYTNGKHGIIVAFSFSKSAREYVKVLKAETEITIDLITVKELFDCE